MASEDLAYKTWTEFCWSQPKFRFFSTVAVVGKVAYVRSLDKGRPLSIFNTFLSICIGKDNFNLDGYL